MGSSMALFDDISCLRRPSTAPLPSHLPHEIPRCMSPEFFYMPPASAGIRDLSAAPDGGSFPPLLLGTDRFDHPYNPRRPSRDALQTHFALESAYQLHDPPSALRRAFSPQLAASSQRPQTDTASLQSSSNTQAPRKKILRPPNAWILYRSDKLADAKDSQGQRTPQAELSKHIAESWRAEPPEVKRQYERQAELRKLQHEAQYPEYKFQPKKRGRAAPAVARSKPRTRKRAATTASSNADTRGIPSALALDTTGATPPSPESTMIQSGAATPRWPQSATSSVHETIVPGGDIWSCQTAESPPALAIPGSPVVSLGPQASNMHTQLHDYRISATPTSAPKPVGQHTADFRSSEGPIYFDQSMPQSAPATSSQPINGASHFSEQPFVFVPPSANYQFPAPAPMPASSLTHVSSSVGTTSLSAFSPPAITSTGSSGVPAWWPFRDVRVVRDPNGMRLGTFLEELAEEEGARAAASSLDPVYHYQAVSPHIRNIMPDIGALSRPDTGYSMTNTPYLSEQGLYSNTPITTEV